MRFTACLAMGALALAACGGGGGGGNPGSCTPGPTATLTINDTGFANSANNACVLLNGQVTFANAGSNAHTINFDTPSCPSPVALAASSSSSPVTFPNTTVNCNFHVDGNTAQSGTVAVTSAVVSGGGH